MSPRKLMLGMAGALALTAATYGGWAVLTVADLPELLPVGKEISLTYSLLQHGATPLPNMSGTVTAVSGDQKVTGKVTSEGHRYTATFTVPTSGAWIVTLGSGFGASNTTLSPIPATSAGEKPPAPLAPAERGRQLFIAKGCGTCHLNKEVQGMMSIGVGPELVGGRLSTDYVAKVLADPTKVTTKTGSFRMPNLNLKPAEITALAAFLNRPVQ